MSTPRIKIIIIYIIFLLISLAGLFFFFINIYDQNSYLNIIEKLLVKQQDQDNDYFILNIENKINSKSFLDLLYYLENNGADKIFFDLNFNNLSDSENINNIKNCITTNKNIFSFLKISNYKGFNLYNNISFDDISRNLMYLKTNSLFIYSSYQNKLKIDNQFQVPSEKIGFITESKSFFDSDNIDILFKFDNKYLLNLGFLEYSYNKNMNISEMIFSNSSCISKNFILYYDQKGRMSYIHNINKSAQVIANSFLELKNSLSLRKDSIESLSQIGLFKSSNNQFELFKDEEKVINDVYNIPEIKNNDKNSLLTIAKLKASQWKSFKEANKKNIDKKKIIIVQNGDFNWVSNYIYEINLFNKGINLNRFPVTIVYLFSIILLALLLIFVSRPQKISLFISVCILLLLIENILYFIFRLVFSFDFPFTMLFILTIYSLVTGLILRKMNNMVWLSEVKSIYRSNISINFTKQIIELLRKGKWNMDSKQYISTFLSVDTSVFSQKEFQEDDIDTISQKTAEIETVMKNFNGIIDSLSTERISCYYGNPPIKKDLIKDAMETANRIGEIPVVLNNNPCKLKIAIHSKKEWYKYLEKDNEKYYTHFGNSNNVLSALLKVANEFEINIIISDAVYKLSGMSIPVRMFDRIKIKGLKNSLRVFELLTENQREEMSELLEYFHAGLKLFEKKKWEDAGAYFRQCLKIKPNDIPSQIYLQRCKDFIYVPPAENWDGSYEVD